MTIVRPAMNIGTDESAWTDVELSAARGVLEGEIERLRLELSIAEDEYGTNVRDVIADAGGEVADIGSLASDLRSGTSMANNVRDILDQCLLALARIDAGVYGDCQSCLGPVGKARLEALPRATLCVPCQQNASRH